MKVLRARLYELERQRRDDARARRPQEPGRQRRPLRAHPHLQLPAGPRHRPPHQPDALQARRGDGGRGLDEIIDALIADDEAEPAGGARGLSASYDALLRDAAVALAAAGIDNARFEARLLLAHAAGLSAEQLIARGARARRLPTVRPSACAAHGAARAARADGLYPGRARVLGPAVQGRRRPCWCRGPTARR